MKFKIGTLFSGIGSPEFGAERVFGKENIENIFACDIDKFARESYLANHTVQTMYEDVTKVDFTKYENELDLLVGGSPCFEVGTKVITKDEYKNI